MSYNKSELYTTLAYVVILCIGLSVVAYTQVNSITEDETGLSISYVPPITVTIYSESGQQLKILQGDVLATPYDVKSIPDIYGGDLIRIDSVQLREISGLWQKVIHITKLQ